ncbi:MAG: class I SAM-dependent methyltransferase [Flavobacteriia bacterium]|nr:class I SAM-dependent methyltransferase [Flavobacteriia bacterium]
MNDTDLFGRAMRDYHTGLGLHKLRVRTQVVDWEDLPVSHFFRTWDDFPELEQEAIDRCRGRVLDMGAGAGAHALELQAKGHSVTAVDNSVGAVEVMRTRGVKTAKCADWQEFKDSYYDTVLLLMNGIGLAGTMDGLKDFTAKWDEWLNPDGQVIFESTDIAYIYKFPEGSDLLELEPYYGEQTYRMTYDGTEVLFPWLFADAKSLQSELQKLGWSMDILYDDGQGSFLARSKRIKSL